ncbi:unnamed protein product [Dovyalis caffra]|uniref:Uncharacterized protein n=1 Tax=Dovyalis caffra TaxID=77055 RepID=A0AAV1SCV5_9ROSI|nr:unnamed protein product [Dovyalis caffra]
MNRVRKSVDVSSFLLVEATGDSEVDSDANMASIDLVDDADDDDAESCCCDSSDHSCASDFINGARSEVEAYNVNCHVVDDADDDDDDDEEEEEEQEKGVHVYQSWVEHGHVGLPMKQKSCVSADSAKESLNEQEKNRLFWEACLAS